MAAAAAARGGGLVYGGLVYGNVGVVEKVAIALADGLARRLLGLEPPLLLVCVLEEGRDDADSAVNLADGEYTIPHPRSGADPIR